MNVTPKYIPAGTAARPGTKLRRIRGVTIHNTGSSASAYNHMLYMTVNGGFNSYTSYHVVVDADNAYQLLPYGEVAWHAGDGGYGTGNNETIAIEICECGDIKKAADNAAQVAAAILKQYGSTAQTGLFQHATWMAKDCPRLIRAGKPYNWATFCEKVRQAMEPAKTTAPASAPKPVAAPKLKEPDPQVYTVKDSSGKIIGTNSDIAKARSLCTSDCTIYDKSGNIVGTKETETVFRLYNPNNGGHHYTTDCHERDFLAVNGWKNEGVAWTAPLSGQEIYRLYSGKEHLLTTSHAEHDKLEKLGWKCEGTGMHSGSGQPVYRLYNPNGGLHHVTPSESEKADLVKAGWKSEGIAFYTA